MSNKANCHWCDFSYTSVKQGREYLAHNEFICECDWAQTILHKLLQAENDHMTACDRTMGATHPCTCGADDARAKLIITNNPASGGQDANK